MSHRNSKTSFLGISSLLFCEQRQDLDFQKIPSRFSLARYPTERFPFLKLELRSPTHSIHPKPGQEILPLTGGDARENTSGCTWISSTKHTISLNFYCIKVFYFCVYFHITLQSDSFMFYSNISREVW